MAYVARILTVAVAAATLSACSIPLHHHRGGSTPGASGDSAVSTTPTSDAKLVVRLGVLVPETGADADLGRPIIDAVRLAARDVATAHAGVALHLVVQDAGSTATTAISGAQALIARHVDAVIGPRDSDQALAVAPLFAHAHIPEISPASTTPALTGISPYFFRTAPSDVVQGKALADRILYEGAVNVAILQTDSAYASGLAAPLVKELRASGLDVTMQATVSAGGSSLASAADEAASNSVDAVVVIAEQSDFATIADALQAAGVDWRRVYGTDAALSAGTDPSGPAIKGATFSSPGVLTDSAFAADLERLDPEIGDDLNYTPETYDAAALIAFAAAQAEGVSGPAIRDALKDVSGPPGAEVTTIAQGLDDIRAGEGIDYDGLSGPIDFTSSGNPGSAYISFYRYTSGHRYTWLTQTYLGK